MEYKRGLSVDDSPSLGDILVNLLLSVLEGVRDERPFPLVLLLLGHHDERVGVTADDNVTEAGQFPSLLFFLAEFTHSFGLL